MRALTTCHECRCQPQTRLWPQGPLHERPKLSIPSWRVAHGGCGSQALDRRQHHRCYSEVVYVLGEVQPRSFAQQAIARPDEEHVEDGAGEN